MILIWRMGCWDWIPLAFLFYRQNYYHHFYGKISSSSPFWSCPNPFSFACLLVLISRYETIRRAVEEWGFEVLKLDFLYASCLVGNGKYDVTMSRAEAMHLGLRTIRAAAGNDTFIIGCGCPIGSAIGFVDGMRVSCDTGPTWYPEFPLPWWDNGECCIEIRL